MIVELGDQDFKKIFNGTKFNLPIRWDGKDFEKSLKELFDEYQDNILSFLLEIDENKAKANKNFHGYDKLVEEEHYEKMKYYYKIRTNCDLIIKAVKEYLRGLPADAYYYINILMNEMIKEPITDFYKKRTWIGDFNGYNSLKLYRVVCVDESTKQPRKRIFHPPYDMCTRISTNRYSIAGFPSLYLGTSVELCMEEMHNNPYEKNAICSRFEVTQNQTRDEIVINVLELAIKPQDFIEEETENKDNVIDRNKNESDSKNKRGKRLKWISHPHVRGTYLLWYPLIAACSFIRAYRKAPFAPEYIVPQLLMQWLRKYNSKNGKANEFFGLRYFSCYSEKSSDLGFNYVFPTSGEPHIENENYCKLLGNSFELTKPIYLHNFNNIEDCEFALNNDIYLAPFFED